MAQNALAQPSSTSIAPAPVLDRALLAWANATTQPASQRRLDLLRDKQRIVADFFASVGLPADRVTAMHVKTWQVQLEDRGLSASTVFGAISRLSSFYQWAMQDPELRERIRHNPATLARPKAPRAYQTDSVKALDDGEVRALLQVVRAKSQAGQLVGKRDYAMLLFYLLTGLRRAEVAGLRWGDLKLSVAVRPAGGAAGADGVLVVTCRVKGGTIENREVREPLVRDVLLDYLAGSGRLEGMEPETPLWTRHDLAGQPGARLTSHAFAKNLKAYAREAGIGDIHVHQTRHTFARIVAEESGSMTDTQDALGHT